MFKNALMMAAIPAALLVAAAPAQSAVLVADAGWTARPALYPIWTFTVSAPTLLSVVSRNSGSYFLAGDLSAASSLFAGLESDVQAEGAYKSYWLSPDFDKLTVKVDPGTYSFVISGKGWQALRLDSFASIMPEPMTWAMMAMGLGAVGWTLRKRQRRAHARVSFA